MTVYDAFLATIQGLEEGENLPEDTTAQDDQEDETDRFRRFMKIWDHPSNRTLIRVLRLGGAKRRFTLAAARHSCGACEAQKRTAGPILTCSS